jgi:hypothetical protein|tara:strand:- start:365 stop:526 length:162 start_codon:yes stop_codon:yes gene_type:complete
MSNAHNEAIMERLYEEAWEELRPKYITESWKGYYDLHYAAINLAKKRWEFDYD